MWAKENQMLLSAWLSETAIDERMIKAETSSWLASLRRTSPESVRCYLPGNIHRVLQVVFECLLQYPQTTNEA